MKTVLYPRKRLVVVTALAIALVGSGIYYYKQSRVEAITYKDFPVQRGDIKVSLLATGTVQPENRLEIKPPVAGRVEQVLVEEGQRIKKGQILCWMSSTERAAMLDAARAEGEAEVKRWEEIYKPTPVVAPINGTLIARNIEAGQSFTNSDAILVMSDRLTVKAQVDETDIAEIKMGQTAEITLDAYSSDPISAKVDQIAYDAKTVNNVTTYVVDVLPDKTPEFMRSGMTANVKFFTQSKEGVLLVPSEAVLTRDGQSTVLLKQGDKPPVEREVSIGVTDGKQTEITDGLSENDIVVVEQVKAKSSGRSNRGSNPFSPMSRGRRR